MHVPVTYIYTFEMDRIIATENKWRHRCFRRSIATNSVVSGGIWTKFELVQALEYVLFTCKYENDRIINSRENVENPFSSYKSMSIFSDAQGQLTP